MSVEMKLGRWMSKRSIVRNVDETVHTGDGPHYLESFTGMKWDEDGVCITSLSDWDDLYEYLGPLSPTPACADQAGAPVVSTVSTETAGEQLRRVNARLNSIRAELGISRASVKDLERPESDLEELAKRLEKEVEG